MDVEFCQMPFFCIFWDDHGSESESKESSCSVGNSGSIPESGRSLGEGNSYPLQYSCLENSVDREAWWATVHRVTKSWTWLSDWHPHFSLWDDHDFYPPFCLYGVSCWLISRYCIPRINPTWSRSVIIFIYCWIEFADILLIIFAFIFPRDVGLWFSFK